MPSFVGLPVSRSALSARVRWARLVPLSASSVAARLSGGQRPILILAASCDRVNRCWNLGACFRAQGATRGKRLQGSGTTWTGWRSAPRRDELKLHLSETAVNNDVVMTC